MKMKSIGNALIVGSILLILYVFIGHDFVNFYLGGKTEMLETAEQISRQCTAENGCPTSLPGWQPRDNGALAKGNMLYFVETESGGQHQSFRLVYRFSMPDDWFEAEGGVGRQITAGWKRRAGD